MRISTPGNAILADGFAEHRRLDRRNAGILAAVLTPFGLSFGLSGTALATAHG